MALRSPGWEVERGVLNDDVLLDATARRLLPELLLSLLSCAFAFAVLPVHQLLDQYQTGGHRGTPNPK